ncbi:CapA family protein [Peribacillus butanolivorans]|uniref:CapA family protein n=1 Tax=Peribacillus butanolivorans TaxID=421767 RepID=UPI00207CAB8C|nr:CapA family protein [Peribacillus butanolivorans]
MKKMKTRQRKYRRLRKIEVFTILTFFSICYLIIIHVDRSAETSVIVADSKAEHKKSKEKVSVQTEQVEAVKKEVGVIEGKETTIKVSAAGDFTIGTDESFPYPNTFADEASKKGLPFFVKNISNIFNSDDLTTVNLETTLTTATQKAEKTFRFKGDPSYTEILNLGSIEAVNLANNHTYDYLEQGYEDTIDNLKNHKVGYFGNEDKYLTTIKGVKVGALGYEGWEDNVKIRKQIHHDIHSLKKKGVKIILVHFHWGVERSQIPNEGQRSLARYTVDNGADLVLGHHPHVVQGIEEYNGKFIVYSLGNFMFGGNKNPSDKDTFVFQQTFHLKNGQLSNKKEIKVIPFRISSVTSRNNYQPTPLEGSEAERVKNKIVHLSTKIKNSDWLVYEE